MTLPRTADNALRDAALDLAAERWRILPCIPAGERAKAPLLVHGFHDASSDPAVITGWWSRWPGAMIGAVVPDSLLVLDVDPRNGGSIEALEGVLGPLPATLSVMSGRGDGGCHLYYLRPAGALVSTRLPAGVDLKQTGYCIMPPSIHPVAGRPYEWVHRPVDALPLLARQALRPAVITAKPRHLGQLHRPYGRSSVADEFTDATCWAQILQPHGWYCLDPDGDADGARWRHPSASAAWSATVRHGLLFVYSGNTPLEVTEPGQPHGYTRFRAWAVLEHGGDLSAAARHARGLINV